MTAGMVYLRLMDCQRSGNCCVTMGVLIMVDTEEGLMAAYKPSGMPCPHLTFEGTKASCAVHDRPEYEGSPCWTYGNSKVDPDFYHKRGRPCPVGALIQKRGGLVQLNPLASQPTPTLKVLGPWRERSCA